jgi:hypothetical protein
VTTVLERLIGTFYASPREADRPLNRTRTDAVPSVAVLAHGEDVAAAGGAVGLAVARERGAAVAVVCAWTGGEPAAGLLQAPASAAACRLAEALDRRGHAARASRRLVLVALPADEGAAAAEAARVSAAAGAVPVVLALSGARAEGFDAALRTCDLVVIATRPGGDEALASLALAGVAGLSVPAVVCDAPAAPLPRLLAAAGIGLAPSARAGVSRAIEVLR